MNWRLLQAVSQPTDTEGLRYIPHTPHAFVLTRIEAVGRRVVKRSLLHHAQTRRRFKRSHLARQFERGELGSHLGLHVEKRQVDYRMAMTCRRMVLVHPDKSRRVQKHQRSWISGVAWRKRGEVQKRNHSRTLRTLLRAPRTPTFAVTPAVAAVVALAVLARHCYAFHRDMVVNAAEWSVHCKIRIPTSSTMNPTTICSSQLVSLHHLQPFTLHQDLRCQLQV